MRESDAGPRKHHSRRTSELNSLSCTSTVVASILNGNLKEWNVRRRQRHPREQHRCMVV